MDTKKSLVCLSLQTGLELSHSPLSSGSIHGTTELHSFYTYSLVFFLGKKASAPRRGHEPVAPAVKEVSFCNACQNCICAQKKEKFPITFATVCNWWCSMNNVCVSARTAAHPIPLHTEGHATLSHPPNMLIAFGSPAAGGTPKQNHDFALVF